jgi:hypothetical protein
MIRCFSLVRREPNDRFLPSYRVLDMQNMASPTLLLSELRTPKYYWTRPRFTWCLLGSKNLPDANLDSVHYSNIFTLPDLLIFLHNLPMFLETHPSVNTFITISGFSLMKIFSISQIHFIILNSIWFPFQTCPGLTLSRRATLLVHVRQVLARLCASLDIAVMPRPHKLSCPSYAYMNEEQVVVTTQLATKFLSPDGTPANYDSGSRAILVPQLGKSVQCCVIYMDERIN